jgi:sulfur carrier protein
MNVIINGQEREVGEPPHLAALLGCVGVEPRNVAVECDGVIVRREQLATTPVKPGARIEIIHFVGGG